MKRFVLAALVVALTAPASDACFRGRAVARAKSVTRTVAKAGVTPVRNIVAAPFRAVRESLPAPCPGGVCPTPAKK
jgi:hypothetical protein